MVAITARVKAFQSWLLAWRITSASSFALLLPPRSRSNVRASPAGREARSTRSSLPPGVAQSPRRFLPRRAAPPPLSPSGTPVALDCVSDKFDAAAKSAPQHASEKKRRRRRRRRQRRKTQVERQAGRRLWHRFKVFTASQARCLVARCVFQRARL